VSKKERKKMKMRNTLTKVSGNKPTPAPGKKVKRTVTHGPAISLERRKPRNANREGKVMYNQL
jgi:hypothetical protein